MKPVAVHVREIGTRDLMRSTSRILRAAQSGATFIVSMRGRPIARLVPLKHEGKVPVLKKLLKLRAKSSAKDWSKRVDEFVYDA